MRNVLLSIMFRTVPGAAIGFILGLVLSDTLPFGPEVLVPIGIGLSWLIAGVWTMFRHDTGALQFFASLGVFVVSFGGAGYAIWYDFFYGSSPWIGAGIGALLGVAIGFLLVSLLKGRQAPAPAPVRPQDKPQPVARTVAKVGVNMRDPGTDRGTDIDFTGFLDRLENFMSAEEIRAVQGALAEVNRREELKQKELDRLIALEAKGTLKTEQLLKRLKKEYPDLFADEKAKEPEPEGPRLAFNRKGGDSSTRWV